MSTRSMRAGMAAATAATLLAGVAAATAEEAPASTVSTLATAVSSTGLKVSGNALLAPLAGTVVAQDAAGDSRLPGTDIVGGTITAAGAGVTRFTMAIGNMGPGATSLPAVMHHTWGFAVVNGDRAAEFSLQALNGGAVQATVLEGATPADDVFQLVTCPPDDNTACTSTPLTGAITDQGVSFDVPNTAVGIATGSLITSAGNGLQTNLAASDLAWLNGPIGTEAVAPEDLAVPAGDVKVGVAPAGTAVEDVALTTTAPVKGKAYTVTLPRPAAGQHVVVVQACHGGVCGPRTSKVVTVS